MNLKKIMIVGVTSLTVFAVSIVWSYRLMVSREAELHATGSARVPTEIGKPEIGIVDQVPFDIDHRLEIWRAAHARRLSSYGWVDRGKGIVHIPIEKAMQQVVADPPDISGDGVPPAARTPLTPNAPSPSIKPAAGANAKSAKSEGKPEDKPEGKAGGNQ